MDNTYKKDLEYLISRIDDFEIEVKTSRDAYDNLIDTFNRVINFLPNALWIIREDGTVFVQNIRANDLCFILKMVDMKKNNYEIEYNERYYLIKNSKFEDKILLSATDITEQKQQDRLATMGQMSAHLSHEIRNPIGSISLMASSLLKRVDIDNKPLIFEIKKSVFTIERIIEATLTFAKGIEISKTEVNLLDIKSYILSVVDYYTFSKDIDIDIKLKDATISADSVLINMLLSNLIFNAIDAIENSENSSGRVELFYENSKDFHIFKVYDNGKEIDDEDMLFKPFKSTKQKGNGLGLYLSRLIAQAHKGDVILDSSSGNKIFLVSIAK